MATFAGACGIILAFSSMYFSWYLLNMMKERFLVFCFFGVNIINWEVKFHADEISLRQK